MEQARINSVKHVKCYTEWNTFLQGSSAGAQESLKIAKEMKEFGGDLGPLEGHLEALKEQGELDKKKEDNLRKFQASITPEALMDSIAAMGATGTQSGVLEAPIIFLQPASLSFPAPNLNTRSRNWLQIPCHHQASMWLTG